MVATIIIITAFRPEILRRCLEALTPQLHPDDEVIAVTGSDLPEEHALTVDFPRLRLIASDRMCMPYQRNLGILAASNEIVAFIDDDAIVCDRWRDSMMELYIDPTVDSVVGREILQGHENVKIHTKPRLKRTGIRGGLQHYAGTEICEILHGQGCNMSFRRSGLEAIDGFDPNYIVKAYLEESDVFERLRRAGRRIMFHPGMDVLHCPAQPHDYSRGFFNLRGALYMSRNATYFYAKYYLFRTQYAWLLIGTTWDHLMRCAKRIAVTTAHTVAFFFFSMAGMAWGTVEAVRWRLRGKRHKLGGLGSLRGRRQEKGGERRA